MSLSRPLSVRTDRARRPVGPASGAPCARTALLLTVSALLLAGCSSMAPLPNSGLISTVVARAPATPPVPPDIEADGLEAQRPPRKRMFERDDDPTQPFSPNYGSVPLPAQPHDEDENHPRREAAIRDDYPIY